LRTAVIKLNVTCCFNALQEVPSAILLKNHALKFLPLAFCILGYWRTRSWKFNATKTPATNRSCYRMSPYEFHLPCCYDSSVLAKL